MNWAAVFRFVLVVAFCQSGDAGVPALEKAGSEKNNGDVKSECFNNGDTSRVLVGPSNRPMRNLNRETVIHGVDGCSFHMDTKELYRFAVEPATKTVTRWSNNVGNATFDKSSNKRPIFMENSFQGMHALSFIDGRYITCLLETPSVEMHVFVVYSASSPSSHRILLGDPARTVELKTIGNGYNPSIAVGTANDLSDDVTELSLGKVFQGLVAEIIVFDRILSNTEEKFVYDGLLSKWIERTPRALPNMFKSLLSKTDEEISDAIVKTAENINTNFFSTASSFRGDNETIYNNVNEQYSHFHPEWLAGIYHLKDKSIFDKALNMMEKYHWVQDEVNKGEWYFYAKCFVSGPLYQTTYSGQGSYGHLGEVIYRAFARWRDPRYLPLADRTMRFWLRHYSLGESNIKSYFFTENNKGGYGEAIVKMFKNHVLDDDAYTEITYFLPMTARMATEFGPAEISSVYDLAPHAQNRYYLRSANPLTGLIPSTAMLDGTPVRHNGKEQWARFANDVSAFRQI